LAVAVIGIAFFTFIVAFMRATVYMHGESHVPHWSESETSIVVGMVALGIGLGSPLVGFLSGGKVELGLVPIGALGMVAATLIAAVFLGWLEALVACIILIGFFTGFYIVPLFTLLQHRAPTTSKGDSIATSNFINVTGAIMASLLFFLLVFAAQRSGFVPLLKQKDVVAVGPLLEDPEYRHGRPVRFVIAPGRVVEIPEEGPHRTAIEMEDNDLIDAFSQGLKKGDVVIESTYRLGGVKHHRLRREGAELKPVYDNSSLPSLLFIGAGLMTLFTLLLLWWQMPDLFLRMFLWIRTYPRCRLEVAGMHHLPTDGPVLLATNAVGVEACLRVLSATDRTARFLLVESDTGDNLPRGLLALAGITNLARLKTKASESEWERIRRKAEKILKRKGVIGLSVQDDATPGDRLLDELSAHQLAPVLPVYYEAVPRRDIGRRQRVYLVAGPVLPPGSSAELVRQAILRLEIEFQQRQRHSIEPQRALSQIH
jgi:hypothetical protein